jgi:hypothetical protein
MSAGKADVSFGIQERQKSVENAVNQIHQIMERWKHRITPSRIELGNRFLMGQVHLLVHFRRIVDPGNCGSTLIRRNPVPTLYLPIHSA